jgi:NAD(P)-dependent dehydrogenase (short-subunit alcohol dehydrogenase family)
MNEPKLILVTGATGYIGGRLVPHLLEQGYRVPCLVRDANRLQGRPWTGRVEVVEGDALYSEDLPAAMEGVWATYYFLHSLTDTKDYRDYGTAVRQALSNLEAGQVETRWTNSLASSQGDVRPLELTTETGLQLERRQGIVNAPPEEVYQVFTGLGGERGWLYGD